MSYLSRYWRKNLKTFSCTIQVFNFFGSKVLIEMPAHTIGFRVLLCFAMASNRILWFVRARARQYYGTWVLPSKLDILADLAGSVFRANIHGGLAGCSWPAYPSLRTSIDKLSLCQWNSYQQPFKSRALGYSSIGPGRSAAAPAPGRPASRWT